MDRTLISLRSSWHIWAPVLFLIVLTSGYWLFWNSAKARLADGIDQWRAAQNASDFQFNYDTATYSGFPYRLHAKFKNATLSNPGAPNPWTWRMAELRLQSLIYEPGKVLADLAGEHTLQYAEKGNNASMHTSSADVDWGRAAVIHNGTAVQQVSINLRDVTGQLDEDPDSNGNISARTIDIYVRPSENNTVGITEDIDVLVTGRGVVLPFNDAAGQPVEPMDQMLTDVTLKGLGPHLGEADAVRAWLTNDGSARVHQVAIKSKTLDIAADGTFSVDGALRPLGTFDVRVGQHQAILDYFVGTGQLDPVAARSISQMLALLALTAGDDEGRITTPLEMKRGKLFVGPVPVAELGPLFR